MTSILSRTVTAVASSALAMLWCNDATAYRTFDGTDAAVAEPDTVEIELGPAEYVRQGNERMLISQR
jgi:hypothetical protein